MTALHTAAWKGHLVCVQLLLAASADPHARNQLGQTPLMDAALHHHADCARALIPFSDLGLVNRNGKAALHLAIYAAAHECFFALLPYVPDVDAMRTLPGVTLHGEPEPFFYKTPLHLACSRDLPDVVEALLKRGASRLARDNKQWTPLHSAASFGSLASLRVVLGPPKDGTVEQAVNSVDEDGCTPLAVAACHGRADICQVLLSAGARLDVTSSSGKTLLQHAQKEHPSNADLIKLLSSATNER